jgi:chaperonin cofactor prefoldin
LNKLQEDVSLYKSGKEDLRNKIRMLERHSSENNKKIHSLEEQLKKATQGSSVQPASTEPSNGLEADLQRLKTEV